MSPRRAAHPEALAGQSEVGCQEFEHPPTQTTQSLIVTDRPPVGGSASHYGGTVISRRRFLTASPALAVTVTRTTAELPVLLPQTTTTRLRPGGDDTGYDPWLEIDADAFRHNVIEVSRVAGGRPILAVVKNNAYGLGDTLVGPLLSSCAQVRGIACVRPAEAIAMRKAGVQKPILMMAEVGEEEAVELVANDVMLTCWLDDSAARLTRIARARAEASEGASLCRHRTESRRYTASSGFAMD